MKEEVRERKGRSGRGGEGRRRVGEGAGLDLHHAFLYFKTQGFEENKTDSIPLP